MVVTRGMWMYSRCCRGREMVIYKGDSLVSIQTRQRMETYIALGQFHAPSRRSCRYGSGTDECSDYGEKAHLVVGSW